MLATAITASCSDSGIPQVDRPRTEVVAKLGVGTEFAAVGRATDHAARQAAASSKSGDPTMMVKAVGDGTIEVVCAGLAARPAATAQVGRTFRTQAGPMPEADRAIAAYERTMANVPHMPTPCP